MNQQGTRLAVYVIVTTIVILLFSMVQHGNPLKPSGLYLPLQSSKHNVDPSRIQIYSANKQNMPVPAGTINIAVRMISDNPKDIEPLVGNYLKKLAATNGANSIVINMAGYSRPSQVTNGLAMYQLSAKAYYIDSVRQIKK